MAVIPSLDTKVGKKKKAGNTHISQDSVKYWEFPENTGICTFKVCNTTISFNQTCINLYKLASNITLKNYIFQYFPVCPIFGVFPRTVITGIYQWEFPPPVFPTQPCLIHLYRIQSSAKSRILDWTQSGRSFMKIRNSSGPKNCPL